MASDFDLNEQFPLDRALTKKVAEQLGIKYPNYPGTNVPVVYTVDFMVLEVKDGATRIRGFDIKSEDGLEEENENRNLEIHRVALEAMDIEHVLVAKGQYPEQLSNNLYIIRNEHPIFIKESELEFFKHLQKKAIKAITALSPGASILEAANRLDEHLQIPTGHAMRAFTQLIANRTIALNLEKLPFQDVLLGDIKVQL